MVLPRPYYGMYPYKEIPPPDSIDDPMINSPYAKRATMEEMRRYRNKDHIRYMISNYYGLVKEVDDWVGHILKRLEELDLARNTLVVFTSDHGEMLGDHGLHSKMVLYEGSAHIPLLMRLPGVIPGGTVVRNPVSHVDLFATILDYLDISGYTSEGRSLRSLTEGKADTGPDFCVSEWRAKRGPAFMVRTQEWKYICGGSAESNSIDALYNLEEDPLEVDNLIGNNVHKSQWFKQAKSMKDRLIGYMESIHHPYLQGVKTRSI
jgi:arylsulfatase A-like enzyme